MAHSEKEQPARLPVRQWPRTWFRDEGFWRSVIGEALGALIAALVIYLFALAAGYVSRPEVWRLVLGISGGGLLAILTHWGASSWTARANRRARDELKAIAELPLEDQLPLLNEMARRQSASLVRSLRVLTATLLTMGALVFTLALYQVLRP